MPIDQDEEVTLAEFNAWAKDVRRCFCLKVFVDSQYHKPRLEEEFAVWCAGEDNKLHILKHDTVRRLFPLQNRVADGQILDPSLTYFVIFGSKLQSVTKKLERRLKKGESHFLLICSLYLTFRE